MGMAGIQEIIYNAKVIKIDNEIFFCTYNQWTVTIKVSSCRQEFILHYNGVYITTEFTYDKDYRIITYVTLKSHIKKGRSLTC